MYTPPQRWLLRELIEKGETFRQLKRFKDALATYGEVVRRYGTSEAPALREAVATALIRKGDLLWKLDRPKDALVACDEVVRRFGASKAPALLEAVAAALANKGLSLEKLHRLEEALASMTRWCAASVRAERQHFVKWLPMLSSTKE